MPAWIEFSLDDQLVFNIPKWVKDAVFYQIFPDRFYNGNKTNDPEMIETYKNNRERYKAIIPEWQKGIKASEQQLVTEDDINFTSIINPRAGWFVFYGGDLQGIEEKIDYLKKLGINALYLNPIFEATSNHRYNTMGYEFIDDNLAVKGNYKASEDYFIDFIKLMHKNGIKVVLDAVFNHTGYEHYAFQDIIKKGENSKYWNWYFIKSYPIVTLYEQQTEGKDPNYEAWWGIGSLPQLNTANPEVKEYLFKVTKKWMDPDGDGDPSDGIDGWRLDVANEVKKVNPDFWKEWRSYVKGINPDAYITGEIWDNAAEYLKGDEFDGVMNYLFREAVLSYIGRGKSSAREFAEMIEKVNFAYPQQALYALQTLVGSHDTARFLTEAGGSKDRLKLAALLQFSLPGAPMIYYGDEIGMEGGDDPDSRRTMVWQERENGIKPDFDLFYYYRKLITVRKEEIALRRGNMSFIFPEADNNILGIKRGYDGQEVLVLINAGFDEARLSLDFEREDGLIKDLLSDDSYLVQDYRYDLHLPSLSSKILKIK